MTKPTGKSDPVLVFFGGALLAIGWLSVVLGGLCTLAVGFFSIVGVGDHEGHVALEDFMPAIITLGFGAGCVWAGRRMRRPPETVGQDDGGPRPD
ncbi:hypothetical protein [Phenylobacterium sp.]|uniref:hypothetical protein n=1 Tax=Phenylobacterium sp. TaxID=1871053 RepID=UPI002CAE8218|nr:hypothetical protein [Phenylobacterium sp.]HLZ73710.1 hypothetical protein [Phenylobacterium sp.]